MVDKIYCAPGNGGTKSLAENLDIAATNIKGLLKFALDEKIDLTIVGPEAPLVEGMVNIFQAQGLKIFGPQKELALLEGSKVFAKEAMKRFDVPTADFKVFTDYNQAREYIELKNSPLVVKADGLAAGKGVFVCKETPQALEAIKTIMLDKKFGSAGERVVIEELIDGQEVSVLVFTDGDTIIPLLSSQDHKRAFDNDQGPNTGGMGAYAPAPLLDEAGLKDIIDKTFRPLVRGFKAEGKPYKGMLYGGIMIKDNKPYILEYNVRFGDPETQAILPKLKSDLVELMLKTLSGELSGVSLDWEPGFCICVVLASGGYPGSYEKNKVIEGLESLASKKDIFVFHAGTTNNDGLLTSGGRVLNVVALADSLKKAQTEVYQAIESIHFDKMFYRRDIASKAL